MLHWRRKVTIVIVAAAALIGLGATLERSNALFEDRPAVPSNTISTKDSFP